MLDVTLILQFDARWRVGTGTSGANGADDDTARDNHGNATLQLTSLRQRLRASAQHVAELSGRRACRGRLVGLGEPCPVAAPCVVCLVFGSSRVPSVWEWQIAPVDGTPLDVFTSSHHARDPWARRPAQDQLYSLATVRSGSAFRALVHWPERSDPTTEEIGLIVAATGALDSIGARTSRMRGQCRAWLGEDVNGLDHNAWVEAFVSSGPAERAFNARRIA